MVSHLKLSQKNFLLVSSELMLNAEAGRHTNIRAGKEANIDKKVNAFYSGRNQGVFIDISMIINIIRHLPSKIILFAHWILSPSLRNHSKTKHLSSSLPRAKWKEKMEERISHSTRCTRRLIVVPCSIYQNRSKRKERERNVAKWLTLLLPLLLLLLLRRLSDSSIQILKSSQQ